MFSPWVASRAGLSLGVSRGSASHHASLRAGRGGGSPAPAGETGRLDEAAACSPGHGFLDPSISALLNPFSFVSVPSHGLNHPMGLVQIRFSYEDRKLRIAEAQTRRKFISVSRE